MAYREHTGWTPANHLVEQRAREAFIAAERAHLRQVQGTLVTTRKHVDDAHIRHNVKRDVMREVEYAKVEHANLLLLAKLHKTVHRPSSAGPAHSVRRGQRSMNMRNRRSEFQRIERENQVRGGSGGGGGGGGGGGSGGGGARARGPLSRARPSLTRAF